MSHKKKILFLNIDQDIYNFLIKQISVNEFIVETHNYNDNKINFNLKSRIKKYDYILIDKQLKILAKKEIKDCNISYIDYNQSQIEMDSVFYKNMTKIYTYDANKFDNDKKVVEVGNIYNDVIRMIESSKRDITDMLHSDILKKKLIVSLKEKNKCIKLKKEFDINLDYEVFWNATNLKEKDLLTDNYIIDENLKLYISNSDVIITDNDNVYSFALFVNKKVIKVNSDTAGDEIINKIKNNDYAVDNNKYDEYVNRNIIIDLLNPKAFIKDNI